MKRFKSSKFLNFAFKHFPHCQYCGKKILRIATKEEQSVAATCDHFVPRSKGGTNGWDNLFICCNPCNTKKGNKKSKLPKFGPMNWKIVQETIARALKSQEILHVSD